MTHISEIIANGRYYADRSGSVFSSFRNKGVLKSNVDSKGYCFFWAYLNGVRKRVPIHQFVYVFFKGSYKSGMDINHIDGNPQNNNIKNLEAVTRSQNIAHSFRIGLRSNKGENHPRSILNDKAVKLIRSEYKKNDPKRNGSVLAKRFGVSHGTIMAVVKRKNWA